MNDHGNSVEAVLIPHPIMHMWYPHFQLRSTKIFINFNLKGFGHHGECGPEKYYCSEWSEVNFRLKRYCIYKVLSLYVVLYKVSYNINDGLLMHFCHCLSGVWLQVLRLTVVGEGPVNYLSGSHTEVCGHLTIVSWSKILPPK